MDLFEKLKAITGSAAEPLMELLDMPEKQFSEIKEELIKATQNILNDKSFKENLKNNFEIMGTKAEDTAETIGFIDDLLEECKETELLTKQKKEFIFSLLNFIKDGLTDFNENPIPSIDVGVKILDERAKMPEYAHLGDSGVDVFALEDVDIQPKDTVLIQLGLAFQLPLGYELQARPKSGITLKTKCRVQLGTIDSIYRGEVGIIIDNIGDEVISIKAGQKVAQLVPAKVPYMNLTNVEELNETDRAEGGFGSTGV